MNLRDFITERMRLISQFEAHWISENKKSPENYPMSMGAGDWDEQLEFWIEEKSGK